ncbi:unnamed protein product [Citrullus colocynthis]|uniref:Uncharacterized protein n=1 Tax=Citrullus colocynthis TaxID=252529 RepID=A0ABP0ZD89_9ROSI
MTDEEQLRSSSHKSHISEVNDVQPNNEKSSNVVESGGAATVCAIAGDVKMTMQTRNTSASFIVDAFNEYSTGTNDMQGNKEKSFVTNGLGAAAGTIPRRAVTDDARMAMQSRSTSGNLVADVAIVGTKFSMKVKKDKDRIKFLHSKE